MWRRNFFVLRDVHSLHAYLQVESLPGVFASKEKHSELVLIIFYLQLINCGHLNSSAAKKATVSSPLEDKHVVNEHHVA